MAENKTVIADSTGRKHDAGVAKRKMIETNDLRGGKRRCGSVDDNPKLHTK